MARKVKDATMDSRAARGRLKVRGKPYYRQIERGLHLGFRRLKGKAGTWVCRFYVGEQQYQVVSLGIADDINDADDNTILTYDQAVAKARGRIAARNRTSEGTTTAPITVRAALLDYITERDKRDSRRRGRKVCSDAGQRLRRYVLGQEARGKQDAIEPTPLAAVLLHALDDPDLLEWRAALPDTLKATTRQRLVNDLKAALNAAYEANRKRLPATLPATIRYGLKAENGDDDDDIGVRDNQILTDPQVTRLLRAAQEIDAEKEWCGDLYRLVLVMAATGARFSQVARLRVGDCQIANGRLVIPVSRKGNGKSGSTPVPVGQDVHEALRPVVVRRAKTEWLLERWRHKQVKGGEWERKGRGPWSTSELTAPWRAIRERAEMPDVIPYALRHSSIVRGIRANLPIRLVAALHDTSVQMIERHYSRWIVDGLEELAAKAVVPLAPQDKGGKVLAIGGR